MAFLKAAIVLAIIPHVLGANKTSGFGFTGLYWDCCKPSCSWPEKASFLSTSHPIQTCDKDDNLFNDYTAGSACGTGGSAYVCNDQQPWAVNDTFSYGYISAYITGAQETDWCCSCYELNFTNNGLEGKRMIVQASNTGYDDPKKNIFGVGAPGAMDYADGCMNRYGGNFSGLLGKTGSPVSERDQCELLPTQLQPGCFWRFDWWNNAQYPNMTFARVECPAELTNRSGCIRSDEKTFNTTSGASILSLSAPGSLNLLTYSFVFSLFALFFSL